MSSGSGDRARQRFAEKLAAGDLDEQFRDAEHVMRQHAVFARPVRHLGVEPVVGHQRHERDRRVDKARHPLDKLRRRQHRAGLLVELKKLDDLRDILREDELVAARQYRDRACAEARQLGPPFRVFEDIDRLELDPTDREKLLESQAAGSTRLPERLQWRGLGHRVYPFRKRSRGPDVMSSRSAVNHGAAAARGRILPRDIRPTGAAPRGRAPCRRFSSR